MFANRSFVAQSRTFATPILLTESVLKLTAPSSEAACRAVTDSCRNFDGLRNLCYTQIHIYRVLDPFSWRDGEQDRMKTFDVISISAA